jgi:hypothetical protein
MRASPIYLYRLVEPVEVPDHSHGRMPDVRIRVEIIAERHTKHVLILSLQYSDSICPVWYQYHLLIWHHTPTWISLRPKLLPCGRHSRNSVVSPSLRLLPAPLCPLLGHLSHPHTSHLNIVIVLAAFGVDDNIFSLAKAQKLTAAGWLVITIVDCLWVCLTASEGMHTRRIFDIVISGDGLWFCDACYIYY